MDVSEAEKNIQLMAETTITPEFVNYIQILGIFLVGMGSGLMFNTIDIMSILTWIVGAGFYGIGWYVRKNFEWHQ